MEIIRDIVCTVSGCVYNHEPVLLFDEHDNHYIDIDVDKTCICCYKTITIRNIIEV